MEKIRELCIKYREIISYVFFGGLTTAVNFLTYALLADVCGTDALAAQLTAWTVSVLFAFVTNKLFVFKSKETESRGLLLECLSFFGARGLSGIIENGGVGLFVTHLGFNAYIVKFSLAVFVVIVNYVLSKFFIFKKR